MQIQNFKISEKSFYFITLALIIWLGLRMANAPMERDEGEYAYAGWQILRGGLPYVDFYNMKFPGVYFFYALIFKCFGVSIWAVRVVCLFLNIVASYFIMQLAQKLMGSGVKYIAGGVFLLLCMSFNAQGFIANTEHFVIFFSMLGLWLIFEKMPFAGGINLAMACMMKQHGFFYIGFALFFIGFLHFESKNFKKAIHHFITFGIGYCIPFILFYFYLKINDIISSFNFFAIEYAQAYSTISKPTLKYISTYKYIFVDNILFWVLFWGALWKIIRHQLAFKKWFLDNTGIHLFLFWLVSFFAICPGWYFRPHYFQLIFPASALIIAYWFKISQFSVKNLGKNHVLAMALTVSICSQIGYFFLKTPETIVDELYDGEYFSSFKEVGLFLRNNTKETDTIGMYGSDPQLFFYAQRVSASGYMYAYPMVEKQPLAEKMMHHYIAEIETKKPEYLIYLTASKGEDNIKNLQHLDNWFATYSQNNYQLKGVFYEQKLKKCELFWSESLLDDTHHPVVYIYQKHN